MYYQQNQVVLPKPDFSPEKSLADATFITPPDRDEHGDGTPGFEVAGFLTWQRPRRRSRRQASFHA